MKKLLFILILFSFTAKAQLVPFAGIEWTSNELKVYNPGVQVYTFNMGDVNLIYGMTFNLPKGLSTTLKAETYSNMLEFYRYQPTVSFYTINAKKDFKQFSIKIEHQCIHSIKSFSVGPKFELYGGYTKLGVYWNIKD